MKQQFALKGMTMKEKSNLSPRPVKKTYFFVNLLNSRFQWKRNRDVVHHWAVLHPCLRSIWRIRSASNWKERGSETESPHPSVDEGSLNALPALRIRSKSLKTTTVSWPPSLSSSDNKSAASRSRLWNTSHVAVRLCWPTSSKVHLPSSLLVFL